MRVDAAGGNTPKKGLSGRLISNSPSQAMINPAQVPEVNLAR